MTLKTIIKPTIRYWTARLSASDPGLIRLQFASRIILTLAFACLVMFLILRLGSHVNLTPVMLTGLVGLQASVIINDNSRKARKITTCLFPLSSAISITLATAFSIIGYHLADIMLMIIVFLTFYVQQFGIRYFSLGMIGFLSFYFSLMYMHGVTFAQLPWYYAGILVAVVSAYIVNFFLFKEQPNKILKRSMSSYRIVRNVTLDLIMDMIQDSNPSARRAKNLTRHITKLNEYTRMVVGQFTSTDPGEVWPSIQTNKLRLYVFDTAMLIETLSLTVTKLQDLHALEKTDVRDLLLQIVQSLRDAEVLREEYDSSSLEKVQQNIKKFKAELELLKSENPDFKEWQYLLRRIESIVNHLVDAASTIRQKRLEHVRMGQNQVRPPKEIEKPEEEEVVRKDTKEKAPKHSLHPSTKKGLQAALASGVAVVIGHFLSPSYPYWSVLAVNMVILGTETVGHSVGKASERFVGTFFGAIVGVVIGHLVAGQPYVTMLLLAVSIFMAYYLMSLSYTVFIFWVTMLLTMAFEWLSVPAIEHVLVLRVLDTLIGAGLGATVAAFLFPHKTTDKIRNSMMEFLSNLKEYVDAYLNNFACPQTVDALADKALDLDRQLQQIKSNADMIKKWPRTMSRSGIEKRLALLTTINYYAKHLVASTNREQRLKIDETVKQTLKHVETYFDKNVDTLCQLLNDHPKRDLTVWKLKSEREWIERAPYEKSVKNVKQSQLIHGLDYVWSINQAITALASDLGAHVERENNI